MIKQSKTYNKKLVILLVIMIALFSILSPLETFCASQTEIQIANDLNSTILEELNQIDFSSLNQIVSEFQNNDTNIFAIDNVKSKVYSIISGESAVSYSSVFAGLLSGIVEEIVRYLPLLSLIIAIGVISNLLSGVKSKFNEKSTNNLIHLVCFLAVVILMTGMISGLSKTTDTAINGMVSQMNILFPILLTMMVGIGAGASASVFQPVVAILSTYVADFFKYLVLPLFMLSFVFGIISGLSDNIKLDKFNSFLSSLFKWCVGIVFTLFFAVFTLQGISAGKFDSLSIRTTKYTIKSYVPVMGGYLSDGMDLILSSTILIKNSLGLVGALMIITTILSPIIEIVIFSLMLKLVSAILQPMGNNKTSNFLSSTSKSVTMLSSCIIAIGFMYLISIGLVMTTSNVVV
ncbi:MAG: stage III sporulation protein AE [Clostridia bacterium]|nr:stage III sporulation protein AE [Clostridia bacterium]